MEHNLVTYTTCRIALLYGSWQLASRWPASQPCRGRFPGYSVGGFLTRRFLSIRKNCPNHRSAVSRWADITARLEASCIKWRPSSNPSCHPGHRPEKPPSPVSGTWFFRSSPTALDYRWRQGHIVRGICWASPHHGPPKTLYHCPSPVVGRSPRRCVPSTLDALILQLPEHDHARRTWHHKFSRDIQASDLTTPTLIHGAEHLECPLKLIPGGLQQDEVICICEGPAGPADTIAETSAPARLRIDSFRSHGTSTRYYAVYKSIKQANINRTYSSWPWRISFRVKS